MPAPDPADAMREAIAHLEHKIAPIDAQIDEIQQTADQRIAVLHTQVAANREQLSRWRIALARLEGTSPSPTTPRARPKLTVQDDDLLRILRTSDSAVSAAEFRRALHIDPNITSNQFSRLLTDATHRGVLNRTGTGPGTRYTEPSE